MEVAVYVLGIVVTALCAILLMAAYGRGENRLLFWSGICFAFLTITNLLLMDDLLVWPEVNLYPLRLLASAVGMLLLVHGLVSESD